MQVHINKQAPAFSADAFFNETIESLSLEQYKGKWVVLFFYPADFTFVCPTELGSLADKYEEFKSLNTEIISISTDTAFVHKAWHDNSPTIKKVTFPMLADPTGNICRDYGTYIDHEGLSFRATFIIDPDGVVKALEFHDNDIGRSIDELLRKIKAAQYVREHPGEACPMNWDASEKTLKPGVDLIGKI